MTHLLKSRFLRYGIACVLVAGGVAAWAAEVSAPHSSLNVIDGYPGVSYDSGPLGFSTSYEAIPAVTVTITPEIYVPAVYIPAVHTPAVYSPAVHTPAVIVFGQVWFPAVNIPAIEITPAVNIAGVNTPAYTIPAVTATTPAVLGGVSAYVQVTAGIGGTLTQINMEGTGKLASTSTGDANLSFNGYTGSAKMDLGFQCKVTYKVTVGDIKKTGSSGKFSHFLGIETGTAQTGCGRGGFGNCRTRVLARSGASRVVS